MILENSVLVALIIGIVQIVKQLNCPKPFLPIIAVAVGIALSLLSKSMGIEMINGIIAGLMAMGLYSGAKAVINK